MDESKQHPTMIIPAGTEISVNEQGQLSIRTPGNLVIQNSGVYSVIESISGSVRIDPDVKVEAVSVVASESCFVAGELTAWRVKANKITLEKGALANIMLQESEGLELDRNARLVGNFASEKELYLMLGRFSRQLRQLPEGLVPGTERVPLVPARSRVAPPEAHLSNEPFVSPDGEEQPGIGLEQERKEILSLVKAILEREMGRQPLSETGRQSLESLLGLIRSRDYEGLRENSRYLISQIEEPSEDLDRVHGMLSRLF